MGEFDEFLIKSKQEKLQLAEEAVAREKRVATALSDMAAYLVGNNVPSLPVFALTNTEKVSRKVKVGFMTHENREFSTHHHAHIDNGWIVAATSPPGARDVEYPSYILSTGGTVLSAYGIKIFTKNRTEFPDISLLPAIVSRGGQDQTPEALDALNKYFMIEVEQIAERGDQMVHYQKNPWLFS